MAAPPNTAGQRWYCKFCLAFRTLNHHDLLEHSYNQRPVTCPVPGCSVRLPCRGIELMHLETRHGQVNPNNEYHCLGCDCHFRSQEVLDWHYGRDFEKPPNSKCSNCPFVGACRAQTLLHFAEQHA